MATNLDNQVLQHRFGVLQRNTPFIVLGSLLVAAALAWILWDAVPAQVLWCWLALLGLHSVARLGFWLWLQRMPPQGHVGLVQSTRRHVTLSLASGLLWGGGAMWLFRSPSLEHHLLVTFMLAGMVTSSLHSQTAHLPAFHAFFIPCALAGVGGNLLVGEPRNQAVALAVFAYCLLAVRFARTLNQYFTEAWQARFEIADLAQRLKVQKEAAEEANLAKSRFLAAASHDLRQPVHALALFIGSLRHRSLDAQARELVEHADQAVKSMEALFGALLDMARLDAGVVRAELRPVALQPLLLKLVGEQRALAETKGLTLRCRPTALWVMSDPLKLERILRNLLVNALRYTDRGGVLLGCRRRAGQVQVQIWDTGCGIPVERQGELFQEFVQLQPDRHQRQGLGLGLAIVKRLAGLLSHRVLLQSRPERGSMFGIALLPCAAPAVIPEGVLPLAPALSVGAGGARQVLVLDDDAAIRTGLRLCLEDCGFDVLAAADLAEMRGLVHQLAACPALIIADHGLGAGLSGVDAIEALRDEFNADIPALVITGNTAPELLREVSAAGLALLHKPVSTELLLATVDALVAAPAVPAAHAVSRLSDP